MSNVNNKSKQELALHRTEQAEDRTGWAHERTLLAKERTFSAWGRTGLSAIAVGLAIAHLLGSTDYPWVARTVGVLMTLTGGLIFSVGFVSYRKALQTLADKGIRGSSIWVIRLITVFLILSAMLALVLIFLM